ncbi:hypothetical protein EC604_00730 [Paenibacillus amylolyticus]|uniref:DUF7674 domain-containing protein n=1 Tax=Paenibacillus amylolyticus TaxID=1451 RepID=A0A5M9WJM9_PAEAM|nr:hypothetical protein [Paenibacillus amylolyticus]KAA8782371.1 hypothetical protein EC604_00730 [Paenibacillus amylolyticus]
MEKDILISQFLKLFPEFNDRYIEHVEFNQEFLGHVFFGDEVSTHVERLLQEQSDFEQIEKFFRFFEWMALHSDLYIVQVLSTTILYNLGGDIDVLHKVYQYMGHRTKKLSVEIEDLHTGKYFS